MPVSFKRHLVSSKGIFWFPSVTFILFFCYVGFVQGLSTVAVRQRTLLHMVCLHPGVQVATSEPSKKTNKMLWKGGGGVNL